MHLVSQFDPANGTTEGALIDGGVKLAIPNLGNGTPPKYMILSTDLDTPVSFKVTQDVGGPLFQFHGVINRSGGPLVINVAGATHIFANATAVGTLNLTPLANQ